MLVLEAKLQGRDQQFKALDEAIRAANFIRNSCLKYWMDHPKVSRNDLYKYCKTLADNPAFPWAKKLNSQARQAHAERAWRAIARFYDNCRDLTFYSIGQINRVRVVRRSDGYYAQFVLEVERAEEREPTPI